MGKIMHNDQQFSGFPTGLLDAIYPIGCYFSTSNREFDPNIQIGGTWTKLEEGVILMSGSHDGEYRVGNEYGENSKSYTPSGSVSVGGTVGNHSLKLSELESHIGHLPVNSGSHTGYGNTTKYLPDTACVSYGSKGRGWNDSGTEMTPHGVSRGGGGAHSHSFSGSGSFSGTTASVNVMQKSIAAYIWHRTA